MHETLGEILKSTRSLPPFPRAATALLQLAARPDLVPSELIEIVQTDPAMTAKVLRICNSAAYGFKREIASLREAGNLLGTDQLVSMALTSCAGRFFDQLGGGAKRQREERWLRCVTLALSGRLMARFHGGTDPDRAYTAGLLQNIGALVLDRFVESQDLAIRRTMKAGAARYEAERAVLGIHHAELGARLCTTWNFPPVLVDAIRNHHTPERSTVDPLLTSTLHLAEILVDAGAAGDDVGGLLVEIHQAALDLTALSAADLFSLGAELRAELARSQELLGV